MNNDIETIFKNADFSAGSDHKQRLHDLLFKTGGSITKMPLYDNALDDDELDKAAGGDSLQFMPFGSPEVKLIRCANCHHMIREDQVINGICYVCNRPVSN